MSDELLGSWGDLKGNTTTVTSKPKTLEDYLKNTWIPLPGKSPLEIEFRELKNCSGEEFLAWARNLDPSITLSSEAYKSLSSRQQEMTRIVNLQITLRQAFKGKMGMTKDDNKSSGPSGSGEK